MGRLSGTGPWRLSQGQAHAQPWLEQPCSPGLVEATLQSGWPLRDRRALPWERQHPPPRPPACAHTLDPGNPGSVGTCKEYELWVQLDLFSDPHPFTHLLCYPGEIAQPP